MDPEDIRMAGQWAAFYRARGMNALPSRTDAKRPMLKYADAWDKLMPADIFDRFPTTNIQVMTGRHWRLLVIDLDGGAAIERFARMGRIPRTWITHSGGGGHHVWFRIPSHYPEPLPKAVLFKGDGEHHAIERLCDHSLVMAPPSIHPTTGRRYRFLDSAHSPKRVGMPADCPGWVLGLRPLVLSVAISYPPSPQPILPPRVATRSSRRFDRSEVLRAIPDKLGLVRSWGVRIAGRPNARGWAPCHAIGRPDVHPSAAVNAASGHYVDLGSGTRLSLFDLGVTLGIYPDFKSSIQDLGEQHASCS